MLHLSRKVIGWSIILGVSGGIILDTWIQYGSTPIVYAREPEIIELKPVIVRAETQEEKIKRLIDDEVLEKIAWCESHLQQFNADGTVLKSHYGTPDYGIFQINDVHFEEAERLDMDVMTIEGNIAFGKYLYGREGARPWSASHECHGM